MSYSRFKTSNTSYWGYVLTVPAWLLNFSGNVWDTMMDRLNVDLNPTTGRGLLALLAGDLPGTTYTVTAASWASGVATLTLGAHSIPVGQYVQVSSVSPTGYNGTDLIVTAVTSTTISFVLASSPGTYVSGGSVVVGTTAANGMLAVDPSGNLNFRQGGAFSVLGGVAQVTAPAAWAAPTLLNSWVNFGAPYASAAYMRDALGFVSIRGTLKSGTTTDGTALFTLPSGFRPPADLAYAVSGGGGSAAFAQVVVTAAGNVNIYSAPGNTFLHLVVRFSTV